jgi:hypothetical protein
MIEFGEPFYLLDQMVGCQLGEDWMNEFNNPYEAAEALISDSHVEYLAALVEEIDSLFACPETTVRRNDRLSTQYSFRGHDEEFDAWLRAVRVRAIQAVAGLPTEPLVDPTGAMMKVDFDGEGVLAWDPERAQHDFVATLQRLQKVPLPGVAGLLAQSVDLMHHEAQGGLTLIRFVGRDAAFLALRVTKEPGRVGPTPKSSFATLNEAQWAVTEVLRQGSALVTSWGQGSARRLFVSAPVSRPVGMILDGVAVGPANHVSALLMREGTEVVVWQAHPELWATDRQVTPDDGGYPALTQLLGCYLHEGWVHDCSDHYAAVRMWADEVDEMSRTEVVAEIDQLFATTSGTGERLEALPTHHVWARASSWAADPDFDDWLRRVQEVAAHRDKA